MRLLFLLFVCAIACTETEEPDPDPNGTGVPSAAQSSATVPDGQLGRHTLIQIQTRDGNGQALTSGGLNIGMSVTGANGGAEVEVVDNDDGTYLGDYVPDTVGVDMVHITLDGSPIGGSPYTSTVEIFGFGTAVIDGIFAPDEWSSAARSAARVPVFATNADLAGSVLFVMNDDINLYLGLIAIDDTWEFNDAMTVRFDNTLDSIVTVNDDALDLRMAGFTDWHFEPGDFTVDDAQQDGSGAIHDAGNALQFEMSHPLNSGDAADVALMPGDQVGICLRYFKEGTSSSNLSYGPGCELAVNEQTLYVVIRIASP